ncbi:hypothetical protein GCM10010168_82340 [Actinoplanes ianthinogenes]|uniref:serine/threonine-protein kinase n=1 Tax=Actinoplanes ianthinogenes TaxID=122358 RepID=UPI001670EAB6|nr:serine/threonine-protein kinase [Actinoplanes ianthinogenes]GGR51139.1 hypothetical protein GCM10010168_82340 [Actinoplanes ianthinogenes]
MDIGGGLFLGGRYRLLDELGAGGMAVVWRARDLVLGRFVAVKLMATYRFGDRIRDEARAAAVLSHPNIAQVYDYGETEHAGQVLRFVVMELVPGETLARRLSAGPLPPRFAMRVGAEIAAALSAAHGEGLVHRDIKPGNVILGPTGAKVVDFGIAVPVTPDGTGAEEDTEVLGTPAYLAPERLFGAAAVPASDVYALGVVLYLALTGHAPWNAQDTRQMLDAHVYVEPAGLPRVAGVPESVVSLCDRCLRKDPGARPSAREVAALLAEAAGMRVVDDEAVPVAGGVRGVERTVLVRPPSSTEIVPPAPAPAPTPTPAALPLAAVASAGVVAPPAVSPDRPGGRRRIVVASAVVALLVAAGTGGWLLLGDRSGPGSRAVPAGQQPPPLPPTTAPGASRSVAAGAVVSTPSRPGQRPGPVATSGSTPATTTTITTTTTTTSAPASTPSSAAAPAPTTETPVRRTLSSSGGTVEATCPEPGTAEILSWTAARSYKVQSADPGPGAAPAVTFKHGSEQVTMTVTCSGMEPSAVSG